MSKPALKVVTPAAKLDADQTKKLKQLELGAKKFETVVAASPITTPDEYEVAGQRLTLLKTRVKEIEAMQASVLDPLTIAQQQIKKSMKATKAIFEPVLLRYAQIESSLKAGLITYQQEAEAEAAAEEARRRDADAKQRAKLEAQAEKLRKSGKLAQAEAKLAQAEGVMTSSVSTLTPKVAGLHYTKKWVGTMVDRRAVLQGVLDGKIPMTIILGWNQNVIDAAAKASEMELDWPGIEVSQKMVAAARAAG